MKNRKCLIFFSLPLIILLSCFGGPTSEQSPENLIQYPLQVGNSWQYQRLSQFINFRPDSVRLYIQDTLEFSNVNITIPGKKNLLGVISTFILREEAHYTSGIGYEGENYYSQDKEGIYLHGFSGATNSLPQKGQTKISFHGYFFRDLSDLMADFLIEPRFPNETQIDSIYLENPPLKVLLYPLRQGRFWIYKTTNIPFEISKRVGRKETIIVPAGKFTTDVVHWLYDLDNDGIWETEITIQDYYSAQGLIKRTLNVLNLTITDRNLNEIGMVDFTDTSELLYYHIQ